MDKLQPLIKHRFWILAALVPPLCIFGYYKANGAMKAATAERITALDGVISGIPSGTGANPTWTDAAKVLNEEYKQAVNVELVRVWEEQQARMTWPPSMQPFVPAEYRGKFPDEAGFTYKNEYADLIADLHASADPITPDPTGKGFSGKVWLDQKLIPRHTFGQLSVESNKIWDAQEDLWYLQLIFDAIRNINRPAENAAKAAVRKVYKIELLGGTGESSVKATASSVSGGEGTMAGMHGAMEMQMGSGQSELGGRSGGGLSPPKVAFDPAEEFGPQGGSSRSGTMQGTSADAMHGAAFTGSGQEGATNTSREPLRYIKADESAKFQERGFYLSVLIDQKKIPDFLVELSNADWPIRIVRFHVGPNPEKPGPTGSGTGEDYGSMYGSAGMSMPDIGYEAFTESSFSDPAFSDPAAMAEMQGETVGPSPLVTSEQMAGLFTHPDLVQLDVCGVITFYKPPAAEVLAAVEALRGASSDSTASAATTSDTAESAESGVTGEAVPAAEPGAAPEPGAAEPAIPGSAPPVAEEATETPAASPAEAPAEIEATTPEPAEGEPATAP